MMAALFFFVDKGDTRVMFCVESASGAQQIALHDGGAGEHFLFLPSYAELETVCLSSDLKNGIVIDGVAMTEGSSCAGFLLDEPYALTINGREAGTIRFCRSANVATMYIDTASESMLRIHKDKNHEESASIVVITADGTSGGIDQECYLKGRGNSTWLLEKRPYLLTVASEVELLGMGAASKWILLANAEDETNLRNELVFNVARQVGFKWTPQSAYVDLYLNGSYSGLYLLAEKVEIQSNRLNLNISEGDFLGVFEYESRRDGFKESFVTQNGRMVGILHPQPITDSERNTIIQKVNQLEQIIQSGEDLSHFENFDMDSWIRKYLIDEIFNNIDSDGGSSYFYHSDGVFYGGPLWDYDLSLGALSGDRSPIVKVAEHFVDADTPTAPYYHMLYKNKSFYERMVEIYRTEYLPVLDQMLSEGIKDMAAEISDAVAMNSVRWKDMCEAMSSWNMTMGQTAEDLIDYLETRNTVLRNIWVDNVEYCSLYFQYTEGDSYWVTSVERGSVLETNDIDLENNRWLCVETGEIFDFSQQIEADMHFVCQSAVSAEAAASLGSFIGSLATRDVLTLLSIFALLLLLGVLLITDLRFREKERGGRNE